MTRQQYNNHHHHLVAVALSLAWSWLSTASFVANAWILQPSSSSILRRSKSVVVSSATQDEAVSLNPLVSSIKPSKTVEIFSLVKQMQSEGETVTSLCVGEPDFLPAPQILEAAHEAIRQGETRYTALTGVLELRQAIADDLQRRKLTQYNPMTEIIVGNGAKQCVYQGILAVCGKGDKVLVPAPYWPSYPEMVVLSGAEPVIVETKSSNGYLLTPEELRQVLQEHGESLKMMILCNPSNPTGGVYNRAQLEELATVLRDYPQVSVLADEIYERLVYADDNDTTTPSEDMCPSFASIPDMFSRTLTINGFSKAYAMTGLRLGYVAAPAPIAKAITTIQSQFTSCAGSISQMAGIAALRKVTDEELDKNVEIMQEKRDFVLDQLAKMKDVTVEVPPRGAFYVMPNVSTYYNGDDTQLCLDLLQSKKLALVPGSSFGAPGTVRISYATSMEELTTAMNKLSEFLQESSS